MIKFIEDVKEKVKKLQSNQSTKTIEISQVPDISHPDFEVLLSKKIFNDFLSQNLPFQQTISIGLGNKVAFFISNATIKMSEGSQIGLRITDATIQYGQNKFRIGLHTKSIEATLFFNIRKEKGHIYISLSADLSNLDIRFFPNWLANLIVNYLKSKWLGPLVDVEITQYLNLDYSYETDFGTVRFKKKLQSIAIQTSLDHIRLKVKFNP